MELSKSLGGGGDFAFSLLRRDPKLPGRKEGKGREGQGRAGKERSKEGRSRIFAGFSSCFNHPHFNHKKSICIFHIRVYMVYVHTVHILRTYDQHEHPPPSSCRQYSTHGITFSHNSPLTQDTHSHSTSISIYIHHNPRRKIGQLVHAGEFFRADSRTVRRSPLLVTPDLHCSCRLQKLGDCCSLLRI